tara:strand:- start:1884 stop:2831 length:948 start_codon:yes stop_codon:yes gene_type:complete
MLMPLNPQCRALVEAAVNGSSFDGSDLTTLRAGYAATTLTFRHKTGALQSVVNTKFPGPTGDIRIRIYRPKIEHKKAPPCLVFYHGGGWAIGDLDTHDHMCRHVAHGAGVVVISVGYRLAPEHKFPVGLADCLAAIHWVKNNAIELDIDSTKIAVGGDSAGGNLAASVTIALRDSAGPKLSLQLLLYPAVDFTADNESLEKNATGYLLTRDALEMFANLYLPNRATRSDPRASPLLYPSHANLPRAFIQTAEFDPLRDEGRAYAEALVTAGGTVTYKCYPGMIHGFARMGAKVDLALTALDDICEVLRDTFDLNT